ncbi:hypothetical protein LSAT2_021702 [Lamellibrachia satsuma]|nr:hypothetical protein LSAT2_021702 [Lamellibrachia satsuma]
MTFHNYAASVQKTSGGSTCLVSPAGAGVSSSQRIFAHTGSRSFACDKCSYIATRACNLRRHQLIHAGVRSYNCSFCADRWFRQKTHLKRHLRLMHHQETSVVDCERHDADVNPDSTVLIQRERQVLIDRPQPPTLCVEYDFTTVSPRDTKQHHGLPEPAETILTHASERPFLYPLCAYSGKQ